MRAVSLALLALVLAGAGAPRAAEAQNSAYTKQFINFFFEIRRYNVVVSDIMDELSRPSDEGRPAYSAGDAAATFDVCDTSDLDNLNGHITARDETYIRKFSLSGDPDDASHNADSVSFVKQVMGKIGALARKRTRKIGAALAYFRLDADGVVVETRVIDVLGEPALTRDVYGILTPGRKLGAPPAFADGESLKFVVPVVFAQNDP
jgi:hypothetical protein